MITSDNKPGLMDETDLEFGGRTLNGCTPRYFDGKYMMLECVCYGFSDVSIYIVAQVKYLPVNNERKFLPLAMFALQQDAMAWIHRRGTCPYETDF